MSLSRCCNAPSFLFTTKRNTPSGSKLRYEVDTSGILPITTEIFKMFPDVSSFSLQVFWHLSFCFLFLSCRSNSFCTIWNHFFSPNYYLWSSSIVIFLKSRICHFPNPSSKSVLSLEMVASSRTANAERKSIQPILFSGMQEIMFWSFVISDRLNDVLLEMFLERLK